MESPKSGFCIVPLMYIEDRIYRVWGLGLGLSVENSGFPKIIQGLYRDNGEENGNYLKAGCQKLYRGYIGIIMEKNMEATV